MTTIVTDGKVVVADTGVSNNGRLSWGYRKVIDRGDRVYAFCGWSAMFLPWINWYEGKRDPYRLPVKSDKTETDVLWIFEGGQLIEVTSDAPYPLVVGVPSAMGSGALFARGALALGHPPIEAVQAAMLCDYCTFGDILTLDLPEALQIKAERVVERYPILSVRDPAQN